MKLDFVDAMAVAIMRAQHGRRRVRLGSPLQRLTASQLTQLASVRFGPLSAFARQRIAESAILFEQIVSLERRRLVENLVRDARGGELTSGHDETSLETVLVLTQSAPRLQ